MFQSWRLKLREADEAVKAGRLEEARHLIVDGGLEEYLPGKRLASRLGCRFVERACQHAARGDWESACRDLQASRSVSGDTDEMLEARQRLAAQAEAEVERRLQQGDACGVLSWIEKFERIKLGSPLFTSSREVARRLESAKNLCRRARFSDAEAQLAAALTLRPDMAAVKQLQADCQIKAEQMRGLNDQLHRALGDSRWDDAAALADEVLALAPDCRLAQEARRRAWAEVGTRLSNSRPAALTQAWSPGAHRQSLGNGHEESCGPRLLLWVDGVGGYLVCLADEVVVGRAIPGSTVDIPILGDISRRHARIRREGGSYVMEPLHATLLDGRPVQQKTPLSDGAEIEWGTGVRLRFRQPHALSGSARLEFVSRHRTQPYADGVLLMAESCVLGPKWQNHVVCREWSGDVVLYRQDEHLYCRAAEAIEIDGQLCDGRGRLDGNSRVVGGDFSLSLEELDRCSSQPLR